MGCFGKIGLHRAKIVLLTIGIKFSYLHEYETAKLSGPRTNKRNLKLKYLSAPPYVY